MPLTIFGISWPRYLARVKGFGSLRKFWRITTAAATNGNEWWKRKRRDKYCLVSWWCMPNFAVFFGMIYFTKIIVASNNGLNADGRGERLGKVVMQTDIISANNQASHPKTFQTLFVYLKWAKKFHTARLRDLRPQIILDGKSKIRKKPPTAIRHSAISPYSPSHIPQIRATLKAKWSDLCEAVAAIAPVLSWSPSSQSWW